jgi:hypothetical protein
MSRLSSACVPHREASLSHPTVEIHLAQGESETRVDPRPIRAGAVFCPGQPRIKMNGRAKISMPSCQVTLDMTANSKSLLRN